MRRLAVLIMVALIVAAKVVFAGRASAQGGCQAFGHSVAEDVKESRPAGKHFLSGAAPLNDLVHAEHEELCG
jgi:hypothetical protein